MLPGLRSPAVKIEVRKNNSNDVAMCQVAEQKLLLNETRNISCVPGVKGSIVRIASTGNEITPLSLCDVQVFGIAGKMSIVTLP